MARNARCPCGHRFKIEASEIGKPIACDQCGNRIIIRSEAARAPSKPASAEPELATARRKENASEADIPFALGKVAETPPLSPSAVLAPAGICPWCKEALGKAKGCGKCGWNLVAPKKKGRSKAATAEAMVALETSRDRSSGNAMPDPKSWIAVLVSPLHPAQVLLRSALLALEYLVLMAGFLGVSFVLAQSGQPTLVFLWFVFGLWFLIGNTVVRLIRVAGKAAHGQIWKENAASRFLAALYGLCVGAIGFLPLYLLIRFGVFAGLRSSLADPSPEVWMQIAAGLAALLWANCFVLMSFVATAATNRYVLNPLTVLRWIWKCLPHTVVCLVVVPICTTLLFSLLLGSIGYAAFAVSPALHEQAEEVRSRIEERLQKMAEREQMTPQERRTHDAELRRQMREMAGGTSQMGAAVVPALLALFVAFWVQWHYLTALFHMLGLIACKREPAIGWAETFAGGDS